MPTKLIRKQFIIDDDENEIIEAEARKVGVSVSNLTRIKYGLTPNEIGRRKTVKPQPVDKPKKQ